VVRIGPGCPVKLDDAARLNRGRVEFGIRGVEGTDDVWGVYVFAVYGSCVGVPGGPANGALIGNLGSGCGVEAGVVFA
jgi:hypothetical protein